MWSVYPDELVILAKKARHRAVVDTMIRLRIAQNPHLEPEDQKEFAEELHAELEHMKPNTVPDAPFDKESFESFRKSVMGSGSKIGVK